MLSFVWDDAKADRNLSAHGVSFEVATAAFRDPFAVEWIDQRQDYGEDRSVLLGMVGYGVLLVVYTERVENIRIISARRALKHEQDIYYLQNAP